MQDQKINPNHITFFQAMISGVAAGSAEVLINHPLWVVKTRMQRGYSSVWALKGIYRGVFSNVTSMVPLISLRISFGTAFQNNFFSTKEVLTNSERIISGLAGGCIPSLIGSPLELLRTQQIKNKLTLLATAKTSVTQYGVRFLLSGMPATATRDALYTCGFFAIMPIIKRKIKPYVKNEWLTTAIAGPTAGAFAAYTSQALDTIKIHQQIAAEEKRHISVTQTAKEIISNQGWKGFFNGATPRIIRVISGVTIISSINEQMTAYFQNANSNTPNLSKLNR